MKNLIKLILITLLVTSCAGQSRTISSSSSAEVIKKVPFHDFKYDTLKDRE